MTGARRVAGVGLVAALVVGGAVVARSVHRGDGDGFVTRSGRAFVVGSRPFRFVGFSVYDAAASDVYSCRPESRMSDAQLDEAFRWARDRAGATVIRFWAYQAYTRSGSSFAGVDRVLATARRNGLRVLPVLDDGPGDCSTRPGRHPKSEFQGDTWYATGYRQVEPPYPLSYRDYVAEVVARYRDDPTILGWSMMNEAETAHRDALGHSDLVGFARDVSEVIRAADPNHLVTVGTQGNGAPGASGADFAEVYGAPAVDFTEVHDWGRWGSDDEPLPGSTADGSPPSVASGPCLVPAARIACSFSWARTLDKPLVVGESGIAAVDDAQRRRRAGLLGAKIRAAFAQGASGYLVWQLNSTDTDTYDVVVGTADPLLPVMRSLAPSP